MITTPDGRVLLFTPEGDDIQGQLLGFLNSGTKAIHLTAYAFTLTSVADLLIQKHQAGLDVRCIFDLSQSQETSHQLISDTESRSVNIDERRVLEPQVIQLLKTAGVPLVIGNSAKNSLIHEKAVTVDGVKSFYGSWNFTVSASFQENHAVIDPSEEVTQAFEQRFTDNWNRLTKSKASDMEDPP